jgi:hypothetical protein
LFSPGVGPSVVDVSGSERLLQRLSVGASAKRNFGSALECRLALCFSSRDEVGQLALDG